MNTVKSFYLGWGSLIVGKMIIKVPVGFIMLTQTHLAGGGAYYFAKKSINADRQQRWEAAEKKRQMAGSYEHSSNMSKKSASNGGAPRIDSSGSPSQEASSDPAPTRHAPESEGQRIREKSKYETSEPFRSKKGDRFS
ncbi:MAG: hypothetical protein M1818_008429 [Claussenomyces sp. TS43310]|nr:MAG: hypothetical protein M1818_008429 [Claussenomyces sp. TS43310]